MPLQRAVEPGEDAGLRSAENHYSVTVTEVPTGAFSKNLGAICPGKRMQPCDAAKGGT
jgi:hypothetical protein